MLQGPVWGGANMPHRFSNAYSSGTDSRIDLKNWQILSFLKEISQFFQSKSLKSNAFCSNYNDF